MDIWKNLNHCYADLYRFARRMLSSHENAEDVAQETMLRFARDKAGKLEGESARKWMFVVARNLCISQLRSAANNLQTSFDDPAQTCSTGPDPSDNAMVNERNRKIEKAVLKLPDEMREVIILREYEGLNYKEISGIIDCPVGTVRSRLARARVELQKQLSPFMEEES